MSSTERATFAGRWADAVADGADRSFLDFEDAAGGMTRWTYAEFDALVSRVAGGLAKRGVQHGSAIHMALANSPSFVAVWLAAARLGAWIVPSDPKATAIELTGHIGRTRPSVGLCANERADVYSEAVGQVVDSNRPAIVPIDEADPDVGGLVGPSIGLAALAAPAPLDRLAVMFTSGTTSAPKGVDVTQANYAFTGDVMAAAAALRTGDRQFVVLPMFHANAQYYSFASAISVGASVALMHGFSASAYLEQAARHRVTHVSLFAAPMRMILARGATPVEDLRIRHVWYAQNVSDEQYETLAGLFGCRPRQLYGMTETIPAVLTNRALCPVPSSMGVPSPSCSVDLRAADGDEPVPDGDVGEIVVTGQRGVTIFNGYLDDPETTSRSFRNGWFRTGDLATRDPQGRYYFAGRRSDVLKVSGENVSVVEVEAVLSAHPAVLEAAVVGEADPIRDEVPVAFVVLRPDVAVVQAAELHHWCETRLSKAKRPMRIEIVDELPRTSVGKIRKFLLRRSPA